MKIFLIQKQICQALTPNNAIERNKKGSDFLFLGFRTFLYLLVVIHFSILALYLAPENPIKHIYKFELRQYVNPWFSQNWNLFAPNPVSTNQTLQVKFIVFKGVQSDTTEWLDLKEMVHQERQKSFWSPLQRLEKYLSGITQSIVHDQIELKEFLRDHPSIGPDSLKALTEIYKINYGHRSLKTYCEIVMDNQKIKIGADSIFLTYRLIDAKFPRFSKRHLNYDDLGNHEITYYELALGRIFKRDEQLSSK